MKIPSVGRPCALDHFLSVLNCPTICQRSSVAGARECYTTVAKEKDDTAICSSIADEMDQDQCVSEVKKDRELLGKTGGR